MGPLGRPDQSRRFLLDANVRFPLEASKNDDRQEPAPTVLSEPAEIGIPSCTVSGVLSCHDDCLVEYMS